MNKINAFFCQLAVALGVGMMVFGGVLFMLAILAIIPLKIYGIYVAICLLMGSLKLGSLTFLQGLAVVCIFVPFQIVTRKQKD